MVEESCAMYWTCAGSVSSSSSRHVRHVPRLKAHKNGAEQDNHSKADVDHITPDTGERKQSTSGFPRKALCLMHVCSGVIRSLS